MTTFLCCCFWTRFGPFFVRIRAFELAANTGRWAAGAFATLGAALTTFACLQHIHETMQPGQHGSRSGVNLRLGFQRGALGSGGLRGVGRLGYAVEESERFLWCSGCC